ncbi:DUF305 domain-containing protein [Streptomyces carpinensis]|uniref:DUF305 domain-containing protein n=1 Tax=Streptomyces carpinensis TaxID=66369 RepID=A0ABV1VZB5_9ACTN|nr:DUF305 domain-containing protein [Streptomyces carpinensis]
MPFSRARRTFARTLTPLAFALLAVAATGCDSGSGDGSATADSRPASGPSVIAPGKPGEKNKVLSAEEAQRRRKQDDSPNTADISYAQMMIVHHQQALEMTRLAPGHARSTKVKQLAERITAEQGPEIETMRSWLKEAGAGEQAGHGHDHGAMPGMATEEQLTELRAAHGEKFDALFLKLMITHHEGALTMATDVKGQGNNIRIEEMADDVIAQQSAEIRRMHTMQ